MIKQIINCLKWSLGMAVYKEHSFYLSYFCHMWIALYVRITDWIRYFPGRYRAHTDVCTWHVLRIITADGTYTFPYHDRVVGWAIEEVQHNHSTTPQLQFVSALVTQFSHFKSEFLKCLKLTSWRYISFSFSSIKANNDNWELHDVRSCNKRDRIDAFHPTPYVRIYI